MENDSEFEHVKMKGHRNSVLALVTSSDLLKLGTTLSKISKF